MLLKKHDWDSEQELVQLKNGHIGDDKVRPSHAANEGQIFDWRNPPETGHPGQAPNCRCWGEPLAPKKPTDDRIEPVSLEVFIPVGIIAGALKIGIRKAADKVGKLITKPKKPKKPEVKPKPKPSKPASVKNPESLRGKSTKEVEKAADKELLAKGWKKQPLKRGDGVRYTDGKGGSFEINKGYSKAVEGDALHKGAYIKTTIGNKKTRVPLKGNPELQLKEKKNE